MPRSSTVLRVKSPLTDAGVAGWSILLCREPDHLCASSTWHFTHASAPTYVAAWSGASASKTRTPREPILRRISRGARACVRRPFPESHTTWEDTCLSLRWCVLQCSLMLESCALSDRGCVRPNNEDCCLADPALGLYVLADGMGGAKAGERASRMAVDAVAEMVRQAERRDSQVLLAAVEEANRRVVEAAHQDPTLEGMGTTLVAALEVAQALNIASVGDSRAYVLDDAGLRRITEDQTWVNEVGRPMGLDEESLRNHPWRHVLTMAIGATAPLTVNYYSVELNPGSLLMMCSDGLHGVVEPQELEQILQQGRNGVSLEESCRRLIQAAKEAGGPDNITTVLVRKAA